MAQFQSQLSNGMWMDLDERLFANRVRDILKFDAWYAPRIGREPLTSREQIEATLIAGDELHYGLDWYAIVRAKPESRPSRPEPEMVRCDCGHLCERGLVMSTSTGTSCPECYDEMSL